jgi:hypothetical protein
MKSHKSHYLPGGCCRKNQKKKKEKAFRQSETNFRCRVSRFTVSGYVKVQVFLALSTTQESERVRTADDEANGGVGRVVCTKVSFMKIAPNYIALLRPSVGDLSWAFL